MLFVSFFLQVHLTGEQSITRKRFLFGSKGCIFRNMGFKTKPAADLYCSPYNILKDSLTRDGKERTRTGDAIKSLFVISATWNISIDWVPLERAKQNLSLLVFNGGVCCCWWRQPTISSPHQFWLWIYIWLWSPIFVRNVCPQDSECQSGLRAVPHWLSFGCSLLQLAVYNLFMLTAVPYINLSQFLPATSTALWCDHGWPMLSGELSGSLWVS